MKTTTTINSENTIFEVRNAGPEPPAITPPRYLQLVEYADPREWHGATYAVFEGETRRTEGGKLWCRIWCLWHRWGWLPVKAPSA